MAEGGKFLIEPELDGQENITFYDFCPHCCKKMPFEQLFQHKAVCSAKNVSHDMIKKFSASDSTFQSTNGIESTSHKNLNSRCKNKAALPADCAPGSIRCKLQALSNTMDQNEAKSKYSKLSDIIKPKVGKCTYCKTTLNANILLFHEKECVHKPIKCPDCSATVLLKDVDEHCCESVSVYKSMDHDYCILTKEGGAQGNGGIKNQNAAVSSSRPQSLKEFLVSSQTLSSSTESELDQNKPFSFCHYCFTKMPPHQVSQHKTTCPMRSAINKNTMNFSKKNDPFPNNGYKSVHEAPVLSLMDKLKAKMGLPVKGVQKSAASFTLSSAQPVMNYSQSSETPLTSAENKVDEMKYSLCYYCGDNIPFDQELQHKNLCPVTKLYHQDDIWYPPYSFTDGSTDESANDSAVNSWSNKKTDAYQNYTNSFKEAHIENESPSLEGKMYEDLYSAQQAMMDDDEVLIAAHQTMMDYLDPLIPCEFCEQLFPASEVVIHMTGCNPTVSLPEPGCNPAVSLPEPNSSFTASQPFPVPGSNVLKTASHSQNTHKHLYQKSGTKSDINLVGSYSGASLQNSNILSMLKKTENHLKQLQESNSSGLHHLLYTDGLFMPFTGHGNELGSVLNHPWQKSEASSDKCLSSSNHPLPKPDSKERVKQKKNISKNLQQIQASLIASSRSNIFNPLEQTSQPKLGEHLTASKEKVDDDHEKTKEMSESEKKSEKSPDPNVCYICHGEVFPGTGKAILTDCGHLYCCTCISAWLRKSPKCPVCSHFWHFSKNF